MNTQVTIAVGKYKEQSVMYPVRTAAQRRVVMGIIGRKDFAYACLNPFGADDNYTCSFMFHWFDTNGVLHGTWITPTGRVQES